MSLVGPVQAVSARSCGNGPAAASGRAVSRLSAVSMAHVVATDGRASNGPSRHGDRILASARAAAADAGVTINALAIADAEPGLAAYYAETVVTGPDAFVMEIADFAGFGEAIVRKLAREIRPALVASLLPS